VFAADWYNLFENDDYHSKSDEKDIIIIIIITSLNDGNVTT
jgi:hypothetical protein